MPFHLCDKNGMTDIKYWKLSMNKMTEFNLFLLMRTLIIRVGQGGGVTTQSSSERGLDYNLCLLAPG